jgi:hypothetical protein
MLESAFKLCFRKPFSPHRRVLIVNAQGGFSSSPSKTPWAQLIVELKGRQDTDETGGVNPVTK